MYNVMVLMSTYNGEKFLRDQIESILKQEKVSVKLLVRDDGSSDETQSILKEYEERGKLKWYSGENLKSARSFMDLLKQSEDSDYYAFSDQDDFWLPEKLYQAVKRIESQGKNVPALYYSKTILVDRDLKKINQSREVYRFTTLNSAVISSNATGCTFCFNKKLRDMANIYAPDYQIMHDGWLHKICLALDGYVYFDTNSYIYYRQHDNNVIGGTITPLKRWKRRIKNIKNDRCSRSRAIQELLNGYELYMPEKNYKICFQIANYKTNLYSRFRLLINRDIYSPNRKIDFNYRMAVLLGFF